MEYPITNVNSNTPLPWTANQFLATTSSHSSTFPASPYFQILHQNEEMIVINKPAGIPMDGSEHPVTVEKWVNSSPELADYLSQPLPKGNRHDNGGTGNQGPTQKQLKFVHQLDAPTSGLLCLAFGRDMASRMAHCFQLRYTKKTYCAILEGWMDFNEIFPSERSVDKGLVSIGGCKVSYNNVTSCYVSSNQSSNDVNCFLQEAPGSTPSEESILIDGPIGYDTDDPTGLKMAIGGIKPRESQTRLIVEKRGWWVDNSDENSKVGVNNRDKAKHTYIPCTLVRLLPLSGRRHQLRLHCRALGHPILGDATYGSGRELTEEIVKGQFKGPKSMLKYMSNLVPSHSRQENSKNIDITDSTDVTDAIDNTQLTRLESYNSTDMTHTSTGTPECNSLTIPRMYLHAWSLTFYDALDGLEGSTKKERMTAKRRRRRETLGFENRKICEQPQSTDGGMASTGVTGIVDDSITGVDVEASDSSSSPTLCPVTNFSTDDNNPFESFVEV
eukprot:Tbor_TRINITY_DN4408_c0_g2::TRINITY_DN4408_c0_g2_i1::g.7924::m.7924